MLPSAAWAVYYREGWPFIGLTAATGLSSALGGALAYVGRRAPSRIYHREALALVGLSWMVVAAMGALPYLFSGVLGPIDAFFESMSGFTTTGSTVIPDIEATAKSILFWRAFTQWLGGVGIVALFIAVLPYLGTGGKLLFRRESTGPDPRGLRPRIQDTAAVLWKIYIGLTVLETAALMCVGMNLYDALCHTFTTLSTGGFSTRQASIAAYDSLAIEIVILLFMLAGATNFALYFEIMRGNWTAMLKDTEWRLFIGIFLVSTLLVTFNLLGLHVTFEPTATAMANTPDYSPGQAFRNAAFQVATCMTDTGFSTTDYDAWPYFSRALLLVILIIGGCAGSTAGGVKIVRFLILMKMAYYWVERAFRPRMVRAIRVKDEVIDDEVQRKVTTFFALYVMWFTGAVLFMSLLGLDLDSAVGGVAACMNNCGPGLGFVGPNSSLDYHLVPPLGKLFLSLCMVAGRIEFLSILGLLYPSFWRRG
ncbi:MAG: TrkH family potassium uptake protein [Candidatus Hydrogenedentes bacterium]|nr:TrkH family potassium uptake protein [Candidatus Hydrogenedentota bacterium]